MKKNIITLLLVMFSSVIFAQKQITVETSLGERPWHICIKITNNNPDPIHLVGLVNNSRHPHAVDEGPCYVYANAYKVESREFIAPSRRLFLEKEFNSRIGPVLKPGDSYEWTETLNNGRGHYGFFDYLDTKDFYPPNLYGAVYLDIFVQLKYIYLGPCAPDDGDDSCSGVYIVEDEFRSSIIASRTILYSTVIEGSM